ncbi:putative Mitochondrial carrier protein [Trypanosoma vivax]|uniref:Mitochondrial carrier protein n=1 Tax=Trypanosoma vivax (strain Y486) TaxID=1055687 RepID=G0U7Y2_TRYVY|nr:hypothetical protein TRVL_01792 [Trypanosoma vivax]KAH8606279.1 putative Mitochondrial carrier protein [Trypanosoma vivax]CCC51990.1 conserved hypothetical protein [Trypanosoma vivax Y486]
MLTLLSSLPIPQRHMDRVLWFRSWLIPLLVVMCLVLIISVLFRRGSRGAAVPHKASVDEFSFSYFLLCFVGGVISGLPHTILTPIDVLKCRVQVGEYGSISDGFHIFVSNMTGSFFERIAMLYRGWQPTLIGYSIQGGLKYFLYEVFKFLLTHSAAAAGRAPVGAARSYGYQFLAYGVASFFAELLADIGLSPWEALKIKIQTTNLQPNGLLVLVHMVYSAEGWYGFYKGLPALWCRQVPCTVVKFLSFEAIIKLIYRFVVTSSHASASKHVQLLVSAIAGVFAGVLCAVVSHPADTLMSKLNQRTGSTGTPGKGSVQGILRDFGWRGLWRGVELRILMVGTLTTSQWLLYDTFKVSLGLPSTGRPQLTNGS